MREIKNEVVTDLAVQLHIKTKKERPLTHIK